MQCDGNANSNVSFQVNTSFEQILFPWHTLARSKGLRTIGSEGPISKIRPGLPCGQGWGKFFSRGKPPQDNSVGSGVVWETGLFSLCMHKWLPNLMAKFWLPYQIWFCTGLIIICYPHCGLFLMMSTLVQVMTCCLMAPSHHLNQCWHWLQVEL